MSFLFRKSSANGKVARMMRLISIFQLFVSGGKIGDANLLASPQLETIIAEDSCARASGSVALASSTSGCGEQSPRA
jgi:hypothetical protein